ncbi:MAG: hypothetical protein C0448_04580 [Sphingobacteriaceae bacterium]|nr:hypothetical protein [Sphingobacteriaceae bacterium]
MNTKTYFFPAIYSSLVILATCITFYGGYTKYINTVSIIGLLLLVPFCVMAMIYSKRSIHNNNIGGKDLIKEGLKFVVFSTIILVIFQSIFFILDFKAYKVNFFQTYGFELAKVQIKSGHLKITEAEIPKFIEKEVAGVTLFKECTSIVFKHIFLGTITSVITAVSIKAKLRG